MVSNETTYPSYNKGEWTELLVLAQLLCSGRLVVRKYRPDEATRELQVVSLSRNSSSKEDFTISGETIQLAATGRTLPRASVCSMTNSLLPAIRVGKWVFSMSEGDDLLELLGIGQLKTGSEKSDLYINVLDPLTGVSGLQGYTIKSFLGSSPTLFNASLATNFTFDISPGLKSTEITRLNSLPIRKMCQEIVDRGHKLTLVDCRQTFAENLSLLDSRMIEVISAAMLTYYSMRCGTSGNLRPIADYLSTSNPLGVPNSSVYYHHKLKDFLEAATYGMVPSKRWDGNRTAPGGLLFVFESGELGCIPPGNVDEHRRFLLELTKFDTPSRTKYRFGAILETEDACRLSLNLQVRFQ